MYMVPKYIITYLQEHFRLRTSSFTHVFSFVLCAFYGGLLFCRCSPNVAHWAVLEFDSALANLPLCHDFCDSWFEACADDMTCAVNWITDWIYIEGENYCKDDAECLSYRYLHVCYSLHSLFSGLFIFLLTFRDVYGDGRGICSMLWGQSFIYSQYSSDDPECQCLVPRWPVGSANPNIAALKNMNVSLLTGSAAIHVASVLGCIVGTIAVWAL